MSSQATHPSSRDKPDVQLVANELVAWFDEKHYVVALSGGVDSAVVAKAAVLSGKECQAVTADSPSVARREITDASELAERIGISHSLVNTAELQQPDYQKNDAQRCYYCKSHLYETLQLLKPHAVIVSGTNFDDLSDYRPGLQAAAEARVRAPLAELRINKQQVRRLAALWELPIHDKPASPCLASRVANGVPVTRERLFMIEQAENLLQHLGLRECRVRMHEANLARIEVPESEIPRLAESEVRQRLAAEFRQLGFAFVTLDLEGFRSGSLNVLHQLRVNS